MTNNDFSEKTWKNNVSEKLKYIGQSINKGSASLIYASMAGMSLWPLVEASYKIPINIPVAQHFGIILGSIFGSVGASIIGNKIDSWRNQATQVKENEVIEWIKQNVLNNSDLRNAMDDMLQKIDAISFARNALNENDKQWFNTTLQKELSKLGNLERFHVYFTTEYISIGTTIHVEHYHESFGQKNIQAIAHERDKATDYQEISYLYYMLRQSGHLSLAGIDKKSASDTEIRLNIGAVYTALLTKSLDKDVENRTMPSSQDKYRSALELLNENKKLVLLGDPGSGKTTFVNYVAWCLAGEYCCHPKANLKMLTAPIPDDEGKNNENNYQQWNHDHLLPVHIILRDFAAKQLTSDNEGIASATHQLLLDYLLFELEHEGMKDFFPVLKKELQDNGCLVLLDGLDEVPEAHQKRDHIKQIIESFCHTYPNCRILVTSRIYAYQKQQWRLSDFKEAILANFSKGQIQQFIDRWYTHIADLRGIKKDDAQGRAELLKRAILGNKRLFALAERPLLLTLMASIHAWRGGSLPEKREELYRDAVDLLLDWWESPKIVRDNAGNVQVLQPSLAEWLKVDREKVRSLLDKLAFEAHKHQAELVGTAEISEDKLVKGLMALSNNPDVRPVRLIEYLSERAGLIVQRGNGIYSFPHRTFQEYLAACYLTGEDFPEQVVELFQSEPNRWREVTLLAGAKAIRGSIALIWALVNELCDSPPEDKNTDLKQLWSAHIAAQALVETIDIKQVSSKKQKLLDRIVQWQKHIIKAQNFPAFERAMAGNNLAIIGDPRPEVMDVDEMLFCLVPGGDFWMGDGKELHKNSCKAFWMGKYPVTNAQFHAFVEAGGYKNETYWTEAIRLGCWKNGKISAWGIDRQAPRNYRKPFDLPNHPVVGIIWYEAIAFTRWLTERWQANKWLTQNYQITLPSEAQWEKAARGGEFILQKHVMASAPNLTKCYKTIAKNKKDMIGKNALPKRKYPWGNSNNENFANCENSEISATSTVGCFPGGKSPYGCEEMSGNVWEWTRSIDGKYPYKTDDGREDFKNIESGTGTRIRGGSFYNSLNRSLCASRGRNYPSREGGLLGFRVVSSPFLTSVI
ncbi:signal transduction protein [Candidatus Magnetomorum sp. HK-1]|nr:signal transduction protein [Candidatus Magnetomorum sp. HK-1]